jgi:DNA-binding response OmpR family regulator
MTGPASKLEASTSSLPDIIMPASPAPRRRRGVGDLLLQDQDQRSGSSTDGPPNRQRLLWVEDDLALMAPLVTYLAERGFDVEFATSGKDGLRMAASGLYKIVLLDLKLPDIDGMQVLRRLRSAGCSLPIIVITGYGSIETAVDAVRSGAADFRSKPLRATGLFQAITSVLGSPTSERPPAGLFREPHGEGLSVTVTRILSCALETVAAAQRPEPTAWGKSIEVLTTELARTLANPEVTLAEFRVVAEVLRLISRREQSWTALTLQHLAERLEGVTRDDWSNVDRIVRHLVVRLIAAGKACVHLREDVSAGELGMDPQDLSNLLVREIGLSFRQLRRVIVMRRGVQMLASSDEQVAQIAYAVGYEHPSAFDHSFKSLLGLSPGDYRRLINGYQRRGG